MERQPRSASRERDEKDFVPSSANSRPAHQMTAGLPRRKRPIKAALSEVLKFKKSHDRSLTPVRPATPCHPRPPRSTVQCANAPHVRPTTSSLAAHLPRGAVVHCRAGEPCVASPARPRPARSRARLVGNLRRPLADLDIGCRTGTQTTAGPSFCFMPVQLPASADEIRLSLELSYSRTLIDPRLL